MKGWLNSRLFSCRTNQLFLLAFVVWFLVFVIFWNIRIPESNVTVVHQKCPNCTSLKNILPVSKNVHFTPVYIVEEHHEVLPYWFGAAHTDIIPKQNNVLLHIDGHIDGGPPPMFNILPLFKFPFSGQKVKAMMQANDAFIVAASQTGLISRFIWVWPPWDKNMTELNDDHIQATVEMGLMKDLPVGHEFPACGCISSETNAKIDITNRCIYLDENVRENDWDNSTIPRSKCNIKKSVFVEVMSENKALELSKSDNWLTSKDHIILDIDEDYYGCEPSVLPLYDVGFTDKEIENIAYVVSRAFCPETSAQEHKFNQIFYELANNIKTVRSFIKRHKLKNISAMNETDNILKSIMEKIKKNSLEDFSCPESSMERKLTVLIRYLFKFNEHQLSALSKVGLCLSVSPKTYFFESAEGMRLCDGFNKPNRTMVLFHTPDMEEIKIRTSNLKNILKNVPTPSLVTVCRSIRDGYTPIKYFDQIEHDILRILKYSYGSIKYASIHYDEGLLGGKSGINFRHIT